LKNLSPYRTADGLLHPEFLTFSKKAKKFGKQFKKGIKIISLGVSQQKSDIQTMFVRKKRNKSGSISIQIIDKSSGSYKVIESLGSSDDKTTIEKLTRKAYRRIYEILKQEELKLLTQNDKIILDYFQSNNSIKVKVSGPEEILGKIFDSIGFNRIQDKLFRYLVITRLVHPVSKLKTIDYLQRYNLIEIDKNKIYRFLDKLSNKYKTELERIAFSHTSKILKKKISVVFYDITTLYFESSQEDELRRLGFSKDNKAQNPQILLGLLVGEEGYPIGYDIYEGNKFEGKTLIPALEKYSERFQKNKPIVIADAGLLSKENIEELVRKKYQYILGARIKNQTDVIKEKILRLDINDSKTAEIRIDEQIRLIISYSSDRAKKDAHNRKRGLERLEKAIVSKKITKKQINNRGYNKYLKLTGKLQVEIDYDKYHQDARWDGLKGYLTNSELSRKKVITNYSKLWQIEKAFRISKTDLKVRPIYHRLESRIQAHLSIAFAAYTIYKELERLLMINKADFSAKRAIELTETIYTLEITLPDSNSEVYRRLDLTEQQKILFDIINNL